MYMHKCQTCGKLYANYQKKSKYCSMACYNRSARREAKRNIEQPAEPAKIESQWWFDDCPFHNGQLKAGEMENMPDWYFI